MRLLMIWRLHIGGDFRASAHAGHRVQRGVPRSEHGDDTSRLQANFAPANLQTGANNATNRVRQKFFVDSGTLLTHVAALRPRPGPDPLESLYNGSKRDQYVWDTWKCPSLAKKKTIHRVFLSRARHNSLTTMQVSVHTRARFKSIDALAW